MFKNGKLFVPPPRDGSDFKELFKTLAAAGAGRPPDNDGFPAGPWTPELLAEAISQIEANSVGVDLRTVQLWFQDNEKGVSPANIRWLARIFGCDDPVATREWQIELGAAQSRLSAKRREWKKDASGTAQPVPHTPRTISSDNEFEYPTEPAHDIPGGAGRHSSLATRSAALFAEGSPLNLPALVFAGIAALGFLAYVLGIHNVTYSRADGVTKQVGFLWTANWTSVFMVLLPLFFAIVTAVVTFWKNEGRPKLTGDRINSDTAWTSNVEATSYSYWAVLTICVLFAGLLQWIGVSLIPLMEGGGDYAIDWDSIAIVHPEIISVPEAAVFTGIAYLYMSMCFYMFFVGLILLYTTTHDFWTISEAENGQPETEHEHRLSEVGRTLMHGIFRCSVLGMLIAIVMKVQSAYLTSDGGNVVAWLVNDMTSALAGRNDLYAGTDYRRPTHYSSLLVAVSSCFVFLYGAIRLRTKCRSDIPFWRMSAAITSLVAGYLLIDVVTGFSILLAIGVLLAVFGLFNRDLRDAHRSAGWG